MRSGPSAFCHHFSTSKGVCRGVGVQGISCTHSYHSQVVNFFENRDSFKQEEYFIKQRSELNDGETSSNDFDLSVHFLWNV